MPGRQKNTQNTAKNTNQTAQDTNPNTASDTQEETLGAQIVGGLNRMNQTLGEIKETLNKTNHSQKKYYTSTSKENKPGGELLETNNLENLAKFCFAKVQEGTLNSNAILVRIGINHTTTEINDASKAEFMVLHTHPDHPDQITIFPNDIPSAVFNTAEARVNSKNEISSKLLSSIIGFGAHNTIQFHSGHRTSKDELQKYLDRLFRDRSVAPTNNQEQKCALMQILFSEAILKSFRDGKDQNNTDYPKTQHFKKLSTDGLIYTNNPNKERDKTDALAVFNKLLALVNGDETKISLSNFIEKLTDSNTRGITHIPLEKYNNKETLKALIEEQFCLPVIKLIEKYYPQGFQQLSNTTQNTNSANINNNNNNTGQQQTTATSENTVNPNKEEIVEVEEEGSLVNKKKRNPQPQAPDQSQQNLPQTQASTQDQTQEKERMAQQQLEDTKIFLSSLTPAELQNLFLSVVDKSLEETRAMDDTPAVEQDQNSDNEPPPTVEYYETEVQEDIEDTTNQTNEENVPEDHSSDESEGEKNPNPVTQDPVTQDFASRSPEENTRKRRAETSEHSQETPSKRSKNSSLFFVASKFIRGADESVLRNKERINYNVTQLSKAPQKAPQK